ncbi:hypothetical protein RND81_07G129800 [Saponaria officinalis]|uniref:Uncharacterized protein n=1 Tax=Saponaria officinalis TaxID=3572 RepID=A0AAW1JTL8_SAPOF
MWLLLCLSVGWNKCLFMRWFSYHVNISLSVTTCYDIRGKGKERKKMEAQEARGGVKRFVYISAADFGVVNYLLIGYYEGKVMSTVYMLFFRLHALVWNPFILHVFF